MFGIFSTFHVDMDLGMKEILWRSVLEYICLSFNIWRAHLTFSKECIKVEPFVVLTAK